MQEGGLMTSRSIGIGAAGSSSAEGNSASHHMARALVWTTVIVGAGVTAFGVIQTALFPGITLGRRILLQLYYEPRLSGCSSSCLAQIFATAQQCRNPTQ